MDSVSKGFLLFLTVSSVLMACHLVCGESKTTETKDSAPEEHVEVDPTKLEYAKGSVCGYCTYCKFCTLCKTDCPCEASRSKPNCHMCKYCKYCNLCSALCDTICTPGGMLDRVSGALINSLPSSYNKEEVDADLDSVHEWIQSEKDEL